MWLAVYLTELLDMWLALSRTEWLDMWLALSLTEWLYMWLTLADRVAGYLVGFITDKSGCICG
jgi:hypothetical protein